MQTFKYPLFAKLVYRYGNIPMTMLLLVHLYISIIAVSKNWIFIFPLSINLGVLYFMNKHYIKAYKTFPHMIEIDNTKMICSDFLIGNHPIEIKLTDIDEIAGGMFSGNTSRPIYIRNRSKGIEIGLSPHIKNYKQLLTLILSNISHDLYNELLKRMKELSGEQKESIVKN